MIVVILTLFVYVPRVSRDPQWSGETMEGTKSLGQTAPANFGPIDDDFSDEMPKLRIKHPDMTAEELERASFSPNREEREAVAGHPNTSPHVLSVLLVDREWKVRLAAARNANTPREALQEARVSDSSESVREAAKETLQKISK